LSRIALHGGEPAVTHSLPTYPDIGDEEINAVVHQMRTGPLSIAGTGGIITEFEENFAKYHDVPFALSTNSGTSTLHVALWGAGVVAGSEVITPANTWISAICAILHANGVPVWCDIKPGTCAADAADIERKITTRTHAIMVCHLFGMPADMDKILAVGRKHGIPVIEDGAQSFGATYKGSKSGNLTTIGCTSFFPSKPLGCYGDGGAIFTSDPELGRVIRQIARHGQDKRYHHARVGLNSRLDTLQAAILLPKLGILDDEIAARQRVAEAYNAGLAPLGYDTPVVAEGRTSAWAQYTVRVKNRAAMQEMLRDAGVPTAVHYPLPLNRQPAVADLSVSLPHSDRAAQEVMSLPMHPYLSQSDLAKIIGALAGAGLG